jgi:hypothetical protein
MHERHEIGLHTFAGSPIGFGCAAFSFVRAFREFRGQSIFEVASIVRSLQPKFGVLFIESGAASIVESRCFWVGCFGEM